MAVSFVESVLVSSRRASGMALRRALPEEHFGTDAKDTVRLAIGLIVTMTGLVLGMLVSSAKGYYDSQKNVVAEMATEVVIVNDLLTIYGPEAKQTRIETRRFVRTLSIVFGHGEIGSVSTEAEEQWRRCLCGVATACAEK